MPGGGREAGLADHGGEFEQLGGQIAGRLHLRREVTHEQVPDRDGERIVGALQQRAV
jgi:hypothetical protein